ncbi:MAG: sigma 54-interacting transcriptional regulator, partial [Terriglobia bacterium]
MEHRVLIVGDAQAELETSFSRLLPVHAGFHCETIEWSAASTRRLQSSGAQLIILLAIRDRASALGLMKRLRNAPSPAPTLAVLPERPDEEFLRLASETADDFIVWPVREGEFRQRVERMLMARGKSWQSVCERLTKEMGLAQLVGHSPLLTGIIQKLPFIADSDVPVLIAGETGTGKELCAHAVHHLSKRCNAPFIPVECGAVPDPLAENELFGHARGAYTGAHHDQKGLAGMAEGGTLFLDEIDALSLPAQAKVLRFLQDGTYRALGAERFIQSNVRVIAATNCDLESLIRRKEFRSDLYFRLNVLQITLPPLRERRGDIRLLAHYFLDSLSNGKPNIRCFSPGALNLLEQHDWPGNVRELRNVVQRAMVFC